MESILFHPLRFGAVMLMLTFLFAYGIYPLVLRMARVWKIYDCPDKRKLQREPVPVLGGLAVYSAIFMSCLVLSAISFSVKLVWMLTATAILLLVGILDDKRKLSVSVRFTIEVLAIGFLVLCNGNSIDTLGGIWGIGAIPVYISLPLSILTGAGIINAINLIDGVDGYSSSYAILVCLCFSAIFYISRIHFLGILTLICAGAMFPFFLHNVFGRTSKMFIGDGGTLMIGTLITVFCFSILKKNSYCFFRLHILYNVGLAPLVLAILSISIFDTLRVMFTRIISGHSPFHPDKTHLHHLFIDMGFSHLGTTISLLLLNLLVMADWFAAWKCGASVTMQLYVVVFFTLLNTFGLYTFMRYQERINGRIYRMMCALGRKTHWENTWIWRYLQKIVDGELFSEGRTPRQL